MNTKLQLSIAISATFLFVPAQADVCPQNTFGGPTICLSWNRPGEPEETIDFNIDYVTNTLFPDVELRTGAEWTVRSIDPLNPTEAGDVGAIRGEQAQDYVLYLTDVDDVGEIRLVPRGGYGSSLGSEPGTAVIRGSVFGNIEVIRSAEGLLGEMFLLVEGDVTGVIQVPVVRNLSIEGSFYGHLIADRAGDPGLVGPLNSLAIRHDLNGIIDIGTMDRIQILVGGDVGKSTIH